MQRPSVLQVSCVVQALPSSQASPGVGVKVHSPPSQASFVQAFSSSQTTGVPAQWPSVLQASPLVQALPSSHVAPGVGVETHWPSTQASLVQAFPSSHLISEPAHLPSVLHVSSVVQASPSSQASPGVGV